MVVSNFQAICLCVPAVLENACVLALYNRGINFVPAFNIVYCSVSYMWLTA